MRGRAWTTGLLAIAQGPLLAAEEAARDAALPTASQAVGAGSFLQMFLGLAVIIGLILGMAWFMRRLGNLPGSGAGVLKVLGGVSLGQRERVVLLQAGDKQLIVGVAPGQIRTLHVFDEPIVVPEDNPKSGFAARLEAAMKRGSDK